MSENFAAQKLQNVTMDDLLTNPHSFGLPTFKEYCQLRERQFQIQREELIAAIDRGSNNLTKIKKHRYFIGGYECKTLEQVERLAIEMNVDIYSMRDDGSLPYRAESVDSGRELNGEIHIHFFGPT